MLSYSTDEVCLQLPVPASWLKVFLYVGLILAPPFFELS